MEVEASPQSRKRDHDSFEELADLEQPFSIPPEHIDLINDEERREAENEPSAESLPTPPVSIGTKRDPSPTRSTTGSLTDAGSMTPSRGQSPMPSAALGPTQSAFTAMNGNGSPAPAAKKPKLTFQEKELRRINKEIKDREKAEEKAKKEAERQAQAEERARKDADKEAERKMREAEKERSVSL